MPSSKNLYAGLLMVGKLVSNRLITKVSTEDYPAEIGRSISVGNPVLEAGAHRFHTRGHIDINISLETAPMAAAFEWGSGEHATRGTIDTYEIAPKDATVLRFPWMPDYVPWSSPKFAGVILEGWDTEETAGTYFFHWVDHPGIAPRPYIEPTVRETAEEVTDIISDGVIAQVMIELDMVSTYMVSK